MTAPIAHPWTIPRDDDDDGPPDVGDPRDLVEPEIARGWTVRDESAWARTVASIGDHALCTCSAASSVKCPACRSRRWHREAEAYASRVESAIRVFPSDPEGHFAGCGGLVLEEGHRAALRAHWAWFDRFWAWWQRRKTINAIEQLAPALRVAVRERCESQRSPIAADPDPRPVLTLANGEAVRADRLYTKNARGESFQCPRLALVDGVQWQEALGGWERSGGRRWPDDLVEHGYDRVYPPEVPIQGLTTNSSVNAHGVDTSRIREGDLVRWRGGNWQSEWMRVDSAAYRARRPHVTQRDGSVHGVFVSGACCGQNGSQGVGAIFDHRPAPRIVLPNGREVVPERMWTRRPGGDPMSSAAIATVEGRSYAQPRASGSPFRLRGTEERPCAPYSEETLVLNFERLWPPLDVVPA